MDRALTFTHVYVDSTQTVLEHHRSFTPFLSVNASSKNQEFGTYKIHNPKMGISAKGVSEYFEKVHFKEFQAFV